MARRTFDVIDICEIFAHWYAGRSKNEIAGSLGLVAEHGAQVPGPGGGGGDGAGRPGGEPGGVGASWRGSGSRSWPIPGCGR